MRCRVAGGSGSLLLSKIIAWMSLLIVSTGLSSGLALGKLIQCSLSARMTCRVCRDLRGCGRSWSRAIQTPLLWIPPAHLCHEPADLLRVLGFGERPPHPAAVDLVEEEQIKETACLLPAFDHQPPCRTVAPAAVGFDRDRLDVEE